VTLVAYEALALPVAFLVPGDWQLPAFLAGLLTLALIGRLVSDHRSRRDQPDGECPRPMVDRPRRYRHLTAHGF